MQSRLAYLYYKIKYKEFRNAKMNEFNYSKISRNKLLDLVKQSKCIIDVPQSYQNGLTMRTFETISAHRKLITSNINVTDYDFYNENNIYIYKGKIDFNNVFFNTKYQNYAPSMIEKYSISSWINQLIYGECNE